MATDLTVYSVDRPGKLAHVSEALGKAGINIDGVCSFQSGGRSEIHVLVEDGPAATQVIEDAGITVQEKRDVLILEAEDKAGVLGDICRKIANNDVNIDFAYVASKSRLVLGVDDLEKATAAF